MNTTFSELLERFIPFVLDKSFIGKSYTIIAYDLDRVYLWVAGEQHTYTIRMWSITDKYIRYTLFEDIPETHSGKALVESQYFYIKQGL